MTRKKYRVSGVIQFTVYADTDEEALATAEQRGRNLEKTYSTVVVDLDPDTVETDDESA